MSGCSSFPVKVNPGTVVPQFGAMPDGRHICPTCRALFRTLPVAKRHFESVHLGVKFTCEICSNEHKRKDELKNHLMKKHAMKNDTAKVIADRACN